MWPCLIEHKVDILAGFEKRYIAKSLTFFFFDLFCLKIKAHRGKLWRKRETSWNSFSRSAWFGDDAYVCLEPWHSFSPHTRRKEIDLVGSLANVNSNAYIIFSLCCAELTLFFFFWPRLICFIMIRNRSCVSGTKDPDWAPFLFKYLFIPLLPSHSWPNVMSTCSWKLERLTHWRQPSSDNAASDLFTLISVGMEEGVNISSVTSN